MTLTADLFCLLKKNITTKGLYIHDIFKTFYFNENNNKCAGKKYFTPKYYT